MPHASSKASPPVRPGAALLFATLVATLLAAAAAVQIDDATSVRAASTEAGRLDAAMLQAEALSSAAIVALDAGAQTSLDGAALRLPAALGPGKVRLQEASGLVDLNASPPERLATLFRALGLDGARAETLAERIADWRDPDDLRRTHGAEARDYADARTTPPANRPFEVESEIARVLGVSPTLAACLEPYLTVDSSRTYVDVTRAPPLLRQTFLHATHGRPTPPGAPFGRVVLVIAEAPISENAVYRLTRWVRLTGDPERPALVHRARVELARADQPPPTSCAGAG